MKLTLKLKIQASPEDSEILRRTTRQYTDSFNRVAAVGWGMDRLNGVELHKLTYQDERFVTDLPSQLVCSARVKATESLKSAFALRRKKVKVSCPQSIRSPIRYDARSATIKLESGTASLSTVDGRKVVKLIVPDYQKDRTHFKVCSSDLCETKDGRLFLHVTVDVPTEGFRGNSKFVGVDLGVNRPLVTSEGQFLGNSHWDSITKKYNKLKSALQSKGTRSAKRHLRRLSGKVNRFRTDCDHVLARQLVNSVEQGTTIIVEDLTDCRSRMKARKSQRRRLHSWSFNRLRTFIDYKAELSGKLVVSVDPRYTSQKCSRCGHIDKKSRVTTSSFHCTSCGFQLDADLNAARNIRQNYMASQGMTPDVGPTSTGLSSSL